MDREKAKKLYQKALHYIKEAKPDELNWVKQISGATLDGITTKEFLTEYCWVVYCSGFRVKVIQNKFGSLKKSFRNFDSRKLYGMRSLNAPLMVFNNEKKASCFLRGAKMVYEEGFPNFKRRLKKEGMDALSELPGIGEITKKHLARNIGLLDTAKDDIWLRRVAKHLNASGTQELSNYLSKNCSEKRGVVDLVIWRFCSDKGWKEYNATSLSDFIQNLDA
ncbi:MAG TPA: hypothetical protein VLY20_07730 [Nitrospiria bacterium]|nr:hypothetical protein [Nitrospiria bacterium]